MVNVEAPDRMLISGQSISWVVPVTDCWDVAVEREKKPENLSVKEGELDAGGAPAAGADGVVPRRLLPEQPDASSASDSGSTNNGAMAVRYQGTFVRAARECALVGGNVVMKIGVEGRIIIGPAGGPGQVDVPLRIAVVEETTAHTKPIVTQLIRIPVTVPSATENPTFTHIEEGVTFPMPANLDNYVVYIGFDPIAAAAQDHPKPAAKPKPKAKPAKTR